MNLKTYLQLGMKLRKIHRVLAFKQSLFLKQYIDHTTHLRKHAQSDFEKSLFKLMINANFGKFIERTRDYVNVHLCQKADICAKHIGSPRFCSMKIISEKLVALFLKQETINLNKAFPIGFTILERSKDFMYQQFYNVIRPKLKHSDVQVLFSDTDSLGLVITTKDNNRNRVNSSNNDSLHQLHDILDFSNYPSTSPMYSRENAAKLGYWKDELQGDTMVEFVGLRSKTYAFLVRENTPSITTTTPTETLLRSKCKGVTKGYKKTINFKQFKKCIKTVSATVMQQYHIRSQNHVIKTIAVERLCFSSFDDKRFLMCPIHSVPYGSKLIREARLRKKCVFCCTV